MKNHMPDPTYWTWTMFWCSMVFIILGICDTAIMPQITTREPQAIEQIRESRGIRIEQKLNVLLELSKPHKNMRTNLNSPQDGSNLPNHPV
jgi:hypothetical protein